MTTDELEQAILKALPKSRTNPLSANQIAERIGQRLPWMGADGAQQLALDVSYQLPVMGGVKRVETGRPGGSRWLREDVNKNPILTRKPGEGKVSFLERCADAAKSIGGSVSTEGGVMCPTCAPFGGYDDRTCEILPYRSCYNCNYELVEDVRPGGEIGPNVAADKFYNDVRANNTDLQARIGRANEASVYECPLCSRRGLDKRCTQCHMDKTLVSEDLTARRASRLSQAEIDADDAKWNARKPPTSCPSCHQPLQMDADASPARWRCKDCGKAWLWNAKALTEAEFGNDTYPTTGPEYTSTGDKEFGWTFKGTHHCTNASCDYHNERTDAGRCAGCGQPTHYIVTEGEPTGSEGSLYGGSGGSIGEGLIDFKSFMEAAAKGHEPAPKSLTPVGKSNWNDASKKPITERMVGYTDLITGKVKQPSKPKIKKEAATHQARLAPNSERNVGGDERTEQLPRSRDVLPPLREDEDDVKTVGGITYYRAFSGQGKPTWVTVPPRPQDEDTDGVTAQSGLTEAIGNAPTRTGFYKKLLDTYPDLPCRYNQTGSNLSAESQDKGTLHKIAMLAHESGLQTKMNKSGYGDWDSTWVLSVLGFRA
jgi:hypothetical protein